jgi:hypothetical protein
MNNKAIIIKTLTDGVDQFNELINNLNEENFEANYNNKWSAGQDLVHLIKVLGIVNIGFTLPKFLLRLLYGANKKEARSFDELQTLYKKSLEGGAKSPTIYIPKPVSFKDKDSLVSKHTSLIQAFIKKIEAHSDFELDTYRLPHPILGKVSLRELTLFTALHTTHHLELLKQKLVQQIAI